MKEIDTTFSAARVLIYPRDEYVSKDRPEWDDTPVLPPIHSFPPKIVLHLSTYLEIPPCNKVIGISPPVRAWSMPWRGWYHSSDEKSFLELEVVATGLTVKTSKINNTGLGKFKVRKFVKVNNVDWCFFTAIRALRT